MSSRRTRFLRRLVSARKLLSPGRLLIAGLSLAALTVAVLWIVPSGSYLYLPDRARPVGPLVVVKGGKEPADGGGIYYDAVIIRRARLFEELFHFVHSGETLVNADLVNPPGVSDSERRTLDLREMARSQDVAGAIALRYLGYKVILRPTGAMLQNVYDGYPAARAGLQPTDVVTAVNGSPVRGPDDLRRLMAERRPGETVRLTVRSSTKLRVVPVTAVAKPGDPSSAFIGVGLLQAAEVKLPIGVRIDAGSIGGPSAGLAFALDVLEELGHDVDRGYRVAATGQLELDGSVLPIGAVKQKTIGVRRAKVDVFLVPAGDNAKEARKYAGPVRVIPVESFRQALQALATLPPKR
jgi:PDZ domain-containing protein